jgi:serine/threonine protein kinase/WD40 repeat protein
MKTVNVIEAVFFAALEKREAGERAAYLDKACNGDPDLRRCVEKLLAVQPRVGEFLQAPAAGLPAAASGATVDHAADERPGTILGPYKLLHEIGEGGMGTVWMAEQTTPVKRRVALKVIKPGMDSRQVLARFEAERQALALMDHPNIAKVLDAGATPVEPGGVSPGRPYFVMELVKGQPITEFGDKNLLTTQDRLELFVAVCNAIQHAHQKGVIHRDIKPSNVLVALYDGKPVPKVIDFGVAKATAEPLTDKTLFTRHGQVVGTFEYMSPEQANLDQLDIDTRSDVYALGVLLYELLTGTTPLDKDRLRQAGFAEVLRLIREEEPPRPSTRLTSSPGLLATAAAYRKTDSQKLPRAVRGELDWIVMKALDKDRNRRFPTANGLAADVERFLKGEPVQACPPTVGYRFRKYARKHRVALAAGAATAAALLIGLALTSWQAVRATNAERDTALALAKAADDRDAAIKLGEKLDTRLGEIKAANEQIRGEQARRRADQYAWDMQMLPLTWEDNNAGEARRMLERQIPGPGENDLRHFEWRFWNRQTHTEEAAFTLPGAEEPNPIRGTGFRELGWHFSQDGRRAAFLYVPLSVAVSAPNGEHGNLKVWDVATRELLLNYQLAEDEGTTGIGGNRLSRDGKVILLTGTLLPKNRPDPDARGRGTLPEAGWVRVLEVDSGKVLFDSRKEVTGIRVSTNTSLSRDGDRLVTQESDAPFGFNENQEGFWSNLRCKVWNLDAADRKPVTIEGANIRSLSPDGSCLLGTAMVDGKQTVQAWDTATGKELRGLAYLLAPASSSFAFSPSGTLVATMEMVNQRMETGGVRTKRKLKVHEADSGKELFTLDLGDQGDGAVAVPTVVFAPDSSRIAVGKTTRKALGGGYGRKEWLILDARSGEVLATFDDPGGALSGIIIRSPALFSDDGTQFILAVENVIHTFDTAKGLPVHTLRGNVNQIADMVALPDGKVRTIEASRTVRDWNLSPVARVRTAIVELPRQAGGGPGSGYIGSVVVSADGARVAVWNRRVPDDGTVETVRVWDAAGKGFVELTAPARAWPAGIPSGFGMLHLSFDGKRVALIRTTGFGPARPGGNIESIDPATLPSPDVIVWDVTSREIIFQREFPRGREGRTDTVVALSPDGATLAIVSRSADGDKPKSRLKFVDLATGHDGKPCEVDGMIALVSFSPDGRRLEGGINTAQNGGFAGKQIAVWDVATGGRICTIDDVPPDTFNGQQTTPGFARSKCWSRDGTRLAIVGPGGAQIHLFDTATGKLARSLDASGRGGRIRAAFRGGVLALSPDGQRIACAVGGRLNQQATINVIDTESGKELLALPLSADVGRNPLGHALRFTPDGHRLLFFTQEADLTSPPGAPRKTYLRVQTWDATPLPETAK